MYCPPFTLTAESVNLIADISALLEHFNIQEVAERELRLRKVNRIKTIHSSLAIEGNELTEAQVADVINGKNIVAPIREIQEVKNAIKVYDIFESLDPFNESDLLKALSIMMDALMDRPGQYRRGGVGVYGEQGVVHLAPPAWRVPELMHDLFEWLRNAKDHLLVRSCVFHYEFEFIHPFLDGNGRTGRLWQSLILGSLNPIFFHLPVENMVFSNQEKYYDAIAQSNSRADSGPFIEFMLSEIYKTIKTTQVAKIVTDKVTDKVTNKVTDKVTNKSDLLVIQILSSGGHTTIKSLMRELNMSESGVKRILSRLTSEGIIRREGSRKNGRWVIIPEG